MKKSRLFVAASFGSLAMVIASPSFAQSTPTPSEPKEDVVQTAPASQEPEEDVVVKTSEVVEDASGAIVVTG